MLNNEKKSKKNHDKIALINHGSFKKLINNCSKWHQSKLCHFKMLQTKRNTDYGDTHDATP